MYKEDSLFVPWIFVPEKAKLFSKVAGAGAFRPWYGRPTFEVQSKRYSAHQNKYDWRLRQF